MSAQQKLNFLKGTGISGVFGLRKVAFKRTVLRVRAAEQERLRTPLGVVYKQGDYET